MYQAQNAQNATCISTIDLSAYKKPLRSFFCIIHLTKPKLNTTMNTDTLQSTHPIKKPSDGDAAETVQSNPDQVSTKETDAATAHSGDVKAQGQVDAEDTKQSSVAGTGEDGIKESSVAGTGEDSIKESSAGGTGEDTKQSSVAGTGEETKQSSVPETDGVKSYEISYVGESQDVADAVIYVSDTEESNKENQKAGEASATQEDTESSTDNQRKRKYDSEDLQCDCPHCPYK